MNLAGKTISYPLWITAKLSNIIANKLQGHLQVLQTIIQVMEWGVGTSKLEEGVQRVWFPGRETCSQIQIYSHDGFYHD